MIEDKKNMSISTTRRKMTSKLKWECNDEENSINDKTSGTNYIEILETTMPAIAITDVSITMMIWAMTAGKINQL